MIQVSTQPTGRCTSNFIVRCFDRLLVIIDDGNRDISGRPLVATGAPRTHSRLGLEHGAHHQRRWKRGGFDPRWYDLACVDLFGQHYMARGWRSAGDARVSSTECPQAFCIYPLWIVCDTLPIAYIPSTTTPCPASIPNACVRFVRRLSESQIACIFAGGRIGRPALRTPTSGGMATVMQKRLSGPAF